MDTQFWGPPGHKLLHSIAFSYSFYDDKNNKNDNNNKNISKRDVVSFFKSIQYVLPCIYCRRSYKQYYNELPISEYIYNNNNNNKTKNLFKWVYLIHNKINDKLRKQGYNDEKDPNYKKVYDTYKKIMENKRKCIVGWNFLYSVIFNYPEYEFELSEIRKKGYITFFTKLGLFLNNDIYSSYISQHPISESMETRKDLVKWLYHLEKKIKRNKCCSFENRCKKIEKYRVHKCKDKTCRSK